MCIIFSCESKRPVDDVLVRADDRNSDGIGLAWRSKGLVRWEKGLEIGELLDRLNNDPPPYPYVMHFRSQTAGTVCKELCHPFVTSAAASTDVKGSAKQVLFHNGHWSGWEFRTKETLFAQKRPFPKGPWNDSRAFAYHVGLFGREVLDWLDLKGEQRICIFSTTTIEHIGAWTTADGFKYSNPSKEWMGAINITPKEEWTKRHLTKKERKALRKQEIAERVKVWSSHQDTKTGGDGGINATLSHTSRLLESAKECTLGRIIKPIPSWQVEDPDEVSTEDQPIPDWPCDGGEEEELPVNTGITANGLWSMDDIAEILVELRHFNWKEHSLARPRVPLQTQGVTR